MSATTNDTAPVLPLEGVRVLALEHFVALPTGTNALSALGAEVIKLEPLEGEQGRRSLPVIEGQDGEGYGSAFVRYSRGKSSLAVDLKRPEGIDLVKRLVQHVDVFAENLRAGKATALGLGPADLAAVNPALIYASVSGYGNEGGSPYSDWPAFAPATEAMAGLPYLAGSADDPRTSTFGAIIDQVGGLNAAIGIIAALYGRPRNKRGYRVDVSLFDTALQLNEHRVSLASVGMSPDMGRSDKNGVVSLFAASDGSFLIAIFRPEHLARLARLIGAERWLSDPRFARRDEWSLHLDDEIRPAVERWAGKLTTLEASQALGGIGVAAAPLLTESQILSDPHVAARDMLGTTEGLTRPARVVSSPVWVKGLPDRRTRLVPTGHDTARLLREIGFADDAIARLADEGVIKVKDGSGR
ncbi:MAG TPA: CoA transferase [Trebonia sp.]|jgi:crotonobetainyl-CoA:carnitine CoA-transferase CaiB-like acyl-CoA transferase